MNEVEEARARFEQRLGELRESVSREVGRVPRVALWVIPFAAAAAGFALALRRRGRRRRLSRSSGA